MNEDKRQTEDERQLAARFDSLLSPPDERLDAMERVVLAGHAVVSRSLAAEWLALLRAGPVRNTALVAVAAVAAMTVTAPVAGLLALAPLAA